MPDIIAQTATVKDEPLRLNMPRGYHYFSLKTVAKERGIPFIVRMATIRKERPVGE